jgi:uncharacterized protein YraI
MKKAWIKFTLAMFVVVIVLGFLFMSPFVGNVIGQFPTVDFPTVTSSPRGPYVVVIFEPSINVRKGPSQLTEQIGLLLVGQEANALGRYGDWIQIEYSGGPSGKGWVFSNLVELIGGSLPIVEPPPTSTPQTTKTIDPTLAAQFIITVQATRLPTFTEPPPLAIPTFETESSSNAPGGIPTGFVIVGLAGMGIFIGLIALLRRG